MIDVYNELPQGMVDSPSVNVFQHNLKHIVRTRCQLLGADSLCWNDSLLATVLVLAK